MNNKHRQKNNKSKTNDYKTIEKQYMRLENKYQMLEEKYETLVQAFLKHGNDIEYMKNKYNQTIFSIREKQNDNSGFWYYNEPCKNELEPIKLSISRDIGLEHIKRKIVEKIYQDYCGIVIEFNKKIKNSNPYPVLKNHIIYNSNDVDSDELEYLTESEEEDSEDKNNEGDDEEGENEEEENEEGENEEEENEIQDNEEEENEEEESGEDEKKCHVRCGDNID
jgi:hypothetical protein